MKTLFTIAFLLAAQGALTFAAPPPAQPDDKPIGDFKDDKEKASYAIGVIFGTQIKGGNMDVDVDTVISAMKEALADKTTKLNPMQAREAIGSYQRDQMAKAAEKNKKEGEAFLAENKKKSGIKTKMVTLPDGKTAELQYKVIKEGTGETPNSNDTV